MEREHKYLIFKDDLAKENERPKRSQADTTDSDYYKVRFDEEISSDPEEVLANYYGISPGSKTEYEAHHIIKKLQEKKSEYEAKQKAKQIKKEPVEAVSQRASKQTEIVRVLPSKQVSPSIKKVATKSVREVPNVSWKEPLVKQESSTTVRQPSSKRFSPNRNTDIGQVKSTIIQNKPILSPAKTTNSKAVVNKEKNLRSAPAPRKNHLNTCSVTVEKNKERNKHFDAANAIADTVASTKCERYGIVDPRATTYANDADEKKLEQDELKMIASEVDDTITVLVPNYSFDEETDDDEPVPRGNPVVSFIWNDDNVKAVCRKYSTNASILKRVSTNFGVSDSWEKNSTSEKFLREITRLRKNSANSKLATSRNDTSLNSPSDSDMDKPTVIDSASHISTTVKDIYLSETVENKVVGLSPPDMNDNIDKDYPLPTRKSTGLTEQNIKKELTDYAQLIGIESRTAASSKRASSVEILSSQEEESKFPLKKIADTLKPPQLPVFEECHILPGTPAWLEYWKDFNQKMSDYYVSLAKYLERMDQLLVDEDWKALTSELKKRQCSLANVTRRVGLGPN